MASIWFMLSRLRTGWLLPDHGQDLVEYAILMALIAVFAMAAVTAVGAQIDAVLWQAIAATF